MAQLETDLAALRVPLSPELLADLDALHRDNPNPCP
jgi:aryl-alcohol dehydrogenase-like predicted oxidoreductase